MLAQRLFQAGLVLTLLFGLGHFGGFLQACRAARRDPRLADLTRAMREQRIDLMGFRPSLLDFREYFSLCFTLLLWTAAALGFAARASEADPLTTVHALAPVYTVAFALVLAASLRYSIAQGVVSAGLIALLFAAAWWLA